MQVYIQVKRTAETLNQCDRTGVICGFCVTGFFANGRGGGVIDDAQSLLSIPTVAVKQPELAKKPGMGASSDEICMEHYLKKCNYYLV